LEKDPFLKLDSSVWKINDTEQTLKREPFALFQPIVGTIFTDFTFHPDGSKIFAASQNGKLYTFDILEKRCITEYSLHDQPILSISCSEQFCVTGSADNTLKIWPLDFSEPIIEVQQHGIFYYFFYFFYFFSSFFFSFHFTYHFI
jgi:WD40 repeat protein